MSEPGLVDAVLDEGLVDVHGDDLAQRQPGLRLFAIGALELDDLRQLRLDFLVRDLDPQVVRLLLCRLQCLLVLVKGLPLAYNRDLQEDKVPLFDAFDTVSACLKLAAALVRNARSNPNRGGAI